MAQARQAGRRAMPPTRVSTTALLPAIKDVLGDAVDEKVLAAWGEAYWFLADFMVKREGSLYAAAG